MYYGLSGELALNEAINKVIDTIPSKNDKALYRLMYATIEQETLAGRLLDKTEFNAGSGLCQFDKIGFEDTKARCPLKIKNIVKEKLGIDISKCTYDMLEYNAFLSILFCRIKYYLVPSQIPSSDEELALYYKIYYNSTAGKATVEEFLKKLKKIY